MDRLTKHSEEIYSAKNLSEIDPGRVAEVIGTGWEARRSIDSSFFLLEDIPGDRYFAINIAYSNFYAECSFYSDDSPKRDRKPQLRIGGPIKEVQIRDVFGRGKVLEVFSGDGTNGRIWLKGQDLMGELVVPGTSVIDPKHKVITSIGKLPDAQQRS